MDPDANLADQEWTIAELDDRELLPHARREKKAELTELRYALADWLRAGGFQPDWTIAPRAAKYYGK